MHSISNISNQSGTHLPDAVFGGGYVSEQHGDDLAAFDIGSAVGSLTISLFEQIFSSLRSALSLQDDQDD
jgi:hypothetical protein